MNSQIKIPPGSVRIDDDAWEFVEQTEDFIVHRASYTLDNGDAAWVYKREPRGLMDLLEANRQSFDESETRKSRFGDGKIVGSIPLNIMFDPSTQIAEKIREGDSEHLKWWLNQSENRKWRTFRGRV